MPKKLSVRACSIALQTMYYLSLIPLLAMAWFNYPSADDFAMANEVRLAYVYSGSILHTIGEAIYMGYYYFMNWCGYYFSDFLMAMPPSVFGERLYVISTFLLLGMFTFGTMFFMDALLRRFFHVNKELVRSITAILMFITVQCMVAGSGRVEAFYWYAGAVNYFFMYSVGLVFLGLLLRFVTEDNRTRRIVQIVIATFLGFAMGGANYMSALSCGIISALVIIGIIYLTVRKGKVGPIGSAVMAMHGKSELPAPEKEAMPAGFIDVKRYRLLLLPALVQFVGLLASCMAPGNAVRSAGLTTMNPIKTVLIAILYVLLYAVDQWTTWAVLCLLFIMIPFLWKAARQMHFSFRYPFLAIVFFYGMTAANIAPPLYAESNIAGGRIQSIFFAQYLLCLTLTLLYLMGWAQRRWNFVNVNLVEIGLLGVPGGDSSAVSGGDSSGARGGVRSGIPSGRAIARTGAMPAAGSFGEAGIKFLAGAVALWIIGSGLCVIENPHFYSATSALYDIANGSAAQYAAEWAERYELLNDPSVREVVVPELSVRPKLLFFSDISLDQEDWANRAMCDYFEKDVIYSTSNYVPED